VVICGKILKNKTRTISRKSLGNQQFAPCPLFKYFQLIACAPHLCVIEKLPKKQGMSIAERSEESSKSSARPFAVGPKVRSQGDNLLRQP
jgi:hypothetical protein